MASGKRASMREGPLAALFRKTEEDPPAPAESGAPAPPPQAAAPVPTPIEQIPPREVPHPSLAPRIETEVGPGDEPRVPSPQERLRNAFSAEIPESLMDAPEPATPAGRRTRHLNADD